MQILKIRFKNINSLKDEHEIDFSKNPLATAGLFAITGVTGSGKTTILDVVTLALFNRIPRINEKISKNVIEKAGVILTRNMPDGYAEVVYECSKGIFRSKWSVSSTRNGTIRDYDMELAQDETGKLLDLQKKDIPEKNAGLIGLTYEQFIRAIILAQGDFATFLKSKEDERGKLLEQITGGEIYRELGKKAFEMNKIHGQVLEDKKKLMLELETRLLKKEDYDELVKQLNLAESELLALNQQKENLQKAILLKNEIEKTEKTINGLSEQKGSLLIELEAFKNNQGRKLEKHTALHPVHDKLQEWRQENRKESDLAKKLERISQSILGFRNKISEVKAKVLDITKDRDAEPMAAISALEEKILKIDTALNAERVKNGEKTKTIVQLSKELAIRFEPENLPGFISNIELGLSGNQSQTKQIELKLGKENLKNPKSTLLEYQSALKSIAGIVKEQEFIEQFQKELTTNENTVKQLDIELKELPFTIEQKQKEVEKLTHQLELLQKDLEIKKLRSSLEEHRKNLQPGQACPLCGSLEHPYFIGEAVEPDALNRAIKETDLSSKQENRVLISLQNSLKEKEGKKEELLLKNAQIGEQIRNRSANRDALMKNLPDAYRQSNMTEASQLLEEHIHDLNNYSELLAGAEKLSSLKIYASSFSASQETIIRLQNDRTKLYSGSNFSETVLKIREDWATSQRDLKNSESLQKETTDEQSTLGEKIASLTNDILPVIKTLGYENIENVFPDLLSAEDAERLRKEKSVIDTKINANQTEIRINSDKLTGLKENDIEKQRDELEKEEAETLDKLKICQDSRDNFLTGKRQQEENKRQIATLQEEITSLSVKNEKWNLLNKYIGDAEGKKFSTFAQQLTLYQLILLANKRLKVLDDRYLLDLPGKEEDESLCIVDTHMGDLRRSVKSLSGGETFLISLALALALSDLAARKVELKSLFIDEGFGSLDKITLDLTIDTLEKLQYESGKSIGVISHVEAMQERITTQIRVSKNGQGYSRIEVR